MKNQKGFTVIEIIVVLFMLFAAAGWVKNLIKLADCDFEPSYKAEVIHGVGLIPVVGIFTGWMDFGR